jgi:hypothetical protein
MLYGEEERFESSGRVVMMIVTVVVFVAVVSCRGKIWYYSENGRQLMTNVLHVLILHSSRRSRAVKL